MKKEFLIGIDLGSSSVKMVQLAPGAAEPTVVRTAVRELSPLKDAAIQEKETLTALQELTRDLPLGRCKVVVAFNSPETGLRVITAPPMPKKELREAIRLEAARYFPFPIADSTIEFQILGAVMEKGAKKFRILVAAAPLKTVESIFSLLKQAGLRPDALIPAPYALYSLKASRVGREEIVCLTEMGDHASELVILKGNQLVFSRKIPVGGSDFTRALTETLFSEQGKIQLSWEEAEKIKKEVGFPKEGGHPLLAGPVSAVHINSMLRGPLERLVAEIDRCFDYYQEESGAEKIGTLILFGRGASLRGLAGALSEGLGVKVDEGGQGEFAVAEGAALSDPSGLNLLPSEVKQATERALRRALFQSVAASVILFLIFIYAGLKLQLASYEKRLAVAEYELMSSRPELERALTESLASQVLVEEPYWEDVFRDLSHLVPNEIYLTKLTLADKRLILKGVNRSKDREQALSSFVRGLEEGIFSDVKLINEKEIPGQAASEFELNAWVDR